MQPAPAARHRGTSPDQRRDPGVHAVCKPRTRIVGDMRGSRRGRLRPERAVERAQRIAASSGSIHARGMSSAVAKTADRSRPLRHFGPAPVPFARTWESPGRSPGLFTADEPFGPRSDEGRLGAAIATASESMASVTDDPLELISIDPAVCHGQPCIKGTRMMATVVLDALAAGLDTAEILRHYPTLAAEGVRAAAAYGSRLAKQEIRPLTPST